MSRRFDAAYPPRNHVTLGEWIGVGIAAVMVNLIFFGFLFLFLLVHPAHATWKPEFANAPQTVQNWYRAAELTPAARKRFPFKSCCAKADTVKTKFKVDKSSGADEWFWLDPKTNQWAIVPADIIHWGESGPNGEAVLFVVGVNPVCFFPPSSGN